MGIIHKSQSLPRKEALNLVIFDNDSIPCDATRLLQQKEWIVGVVEDIN